MRRKSDGSRFLGAGDLKHLEGLPKKQSLGKRAKRLSGRVESGKVAFEGDESLGRQFIEALRAQDEEDWATHHFHTYPARFSPLGAKILLASLEGKRFADPFCGGGTLLLEAMLADREVFGSDLNPVAVMVSNARMQILKPQELDEFLDLVDLVANEAKDYVESNQKLWLPQPILKIKSWYKANMFNELAALYTAHSAYHNEYSILLKAVFSSIVVKYSLRASDTSNRVVYVPRKDGSALKAFVDKARELAEGLNDFEKRLSPNALPAQIKISDARNPEFSEVDCIVTSPPYPGTYDYLPLQQLRMAWLDFSANEREEIGSRRSFKRGRNAYEGWQKDTDAWMKAAAKALKPGGTLCVIVGEGISGGRSFKVAAPSKSAAAKAKLKFISSGSVERRDPATQDKKIEYILAFKKEG